MSNTDVIQLQKKVRINEFYNMNRVDSGNYPKLNRKDNSYNQSNFNEFKQDYINERWNDLYNINAEEEFHLQQIINWSLI